MKIIFFLLLTVSMAFAVTTQFYPDDQGRAQTPPSLNPEKIRLLPPHVGCLEWGDFIDVNLQQAEAAISDLKLNKNLVQESAGIIAVHWVYIPPFENAHDADREIKELNKLGIDSFRVQDESEWHNAILLVAFREKKAAVEKLAALKNKGVAAATIDKRNLEQIKFVIREPDEDINQKMQILAAQFGGSRLQIVTCERL